MQDYYKKVTCFFEQYVDSSSDNYDFDGTFKLRAIRLIIKLLLEENVFTSKMKIKQQALRDYGIILKDDFFEKEG